MSPIPFLRKKLRVIAPLSDLFTKAMDYRKYCLASKCPGYDSSMAGRVPPMQKKLKVQTETPAFSEEDPMAVLGFLARLNFKKHH